MRNVWWISCKEIANRFFISVAVRFDLGHLVRLGGKWGRRPESDTQSHRFTERKNERRWCMKKKDETANERLSYNLMILKPWMWLMEWCKWFKHFYSLPYTNLTILCTNELLNENQWSLSSPYFSYSKEEIKSWTAFCHSFNKITD